MLGSQHTMTDTTSSGRSDPVGTTVSPGGVNFCLFSRSAAAVELLLFDGAEDATPSRVISLGASHNRTYHYWHGFVPGIQAGQIYGYRVQGESNPAAGIF